MKKSILSSVKNINKKYRELFLFGVTSAFIIVTLLFMTKTDLYEKVLKYTTHIGNNDELQIIHDFTSGMEVRQQLSVPEAFEFISFRFADHDQRLAGKILIQILDGDTGELLLYKEQEAASVFYPNPVTISFEAFGGGQANKQYEIVLQAADTQEVALGVFGYSTDSNQAIINAEVSEYALSIGVHSHTVLFRNLTIVVLGIGIIALILTVLGTFVRRLKEENIFLLLAIPFGICMLIMWPGNEVYDELRHYHTVYNYSNILLGYGESDNIFELQMRQCDIPDEEALNNRSGIIESQAHNYWYYLQRVGERADNTDVILTDISRAPIVENGTWIEYLPSVLGMTLGRMLGLNYFWMMTLARLVIMGSYILMCYYAIRLIPAFKPVLILVSALPINLYQASGISYDGFTFGAGIIVFSFIMKLWYKGLVRKDWVKLAFAVFALGTCKGGVYLTLILLMCFIPKAMYQGRKWIKFSGIFSIAGVSMLGSFVPVIMRWFGLGNNESYIVNEVEIIGGKLHLAYMFKYPVEFIKMVILTLIENMDVYWAHMLGYRTAWSNEPIKMAVMLPFLVLLILAAVRTTEDDFQIGAGARLGILGILLIEVIGMHAIFLVDTSIYSDIIVGVQGRYFVLFIPLILLLFRNNGLVFQEKKEYIYPCCSMAQLVYLYFFLEMFMCA